MARDEHATGTRATDVQSLLDLAEGWRGVSRRFHTTKSHELLGADPGPGITAVQLEWAAREIERLRDA